MSVENRDVIDIVNIDKDGSVVLTISDHLEWDADNEHLLILQDKLNAYLNAIESGNLYEIYPQAKNKPITIKLVTKYPPNKDGVNFIKRVKSIVESAGYGFYFRLYEG